MKSNKIIPGVISILWIIAFYSCVVEIPLHGDISGYVSDKETSEPIFNATVKLTLTLDSTLSAENGFYQLTNIPSGDYHIQASKTAYESITKVVTVDEAETSETDFALKGIPNPVFSDTYLDFALEKTEGYFTISNNGKGELRYDISTSQGWITVEPDEGTITSETDTIRVIIDRIGLPSNKLEENICVLSYISNGIQTDKIRVLANGVVDQDGNYYGTVTIGSQTWMAENLRTGEMITWAVDNPALDNNVIEKYCYSNLESSCDLYGGMYPMQELYGYMDPGTEIIQGICPDGWHIAQQVDWDLLFQAVGGPSIAGGKLKDTGTLEAGTGLWHQPNLGATNQYGFTALPGGHHSGSTGELTGLGWVGAYFSGISPFNPGFFRYFELESSCMGVTGYDSDPIYNPVAYVRCVKDP